MSWALPILERPSMPSRAASRRSSVTVIAPAPVPVPFDAPRLRAAAFAPSRPKLPHVLPPDPEGQPDRLTRLARDRDLDGRAVAPAGKLVLADPLDGDD